jgi:hypothetical protein
MAKPEFLESKFELRACFFSPYSPLFLFIPLKPPLYLSDSICLGSFNTFSLLFNFCIL